jgi:hypothetical protein
LVLEELGRVRHANKPNFDHPTEREQQRTF